MNAEELANMQAPQEEAPRDGGLLGLGISSKDDLLTWSEEKLLKALVKMFPTMASGKGDGKCSCNLPILLVLRSGDLILMDLDLPTNGYVGGSAVASPPQSDWSLIDCSLPNRRCMITPIHVKNIGPHRIGTKCTGGFLPLATCLIHQAGMVPECALVSKLHETTSVQLQMGELDLSSVIPTASSPKFLLYRLLKFGSAQLFSNFDGSLTGGVEADHDEHAVDRQDQRAHRARQLWQLREGMPSPHSRLLRGPVRHRCGAWRPAHERSQDQTRLQAAVLV